MGLAGELLILAYTYRNEDRTNLHWMFGRGSLLY